MTAVSGREVSIKCVYIFFNFTIIIICVSMSIINYNKVTTANKIAVRKCWLNNNH